MAGYNYKMHEEIIDKHINHGYSTRLLAQEYGIGRTTIQSWLRAYRTQTGDCPQPQNRKVVKEANETFIKQRMMNELKMQIDVLKSFQKELERWDAHK